MNRSDDSDSLDGMSSGMGSGSPAPTRPLGTPIPKSSTASALVTSQPPLTMQSLGPSNLRKTTTETKPQILPVPTTKGSLITRLKTTTTITTTTTTTTTHTSTEFISSSTLAPGDDADQLPLPVIIGAGCGGAFLLLLLVLGVVCWYRRRSKMPVKRRQHKSKGSGSNGMAAMYWVQSTSSDNVFLVSGDTQLLSNRDSENDPATANTNTGKSTPPDVLLTPHSRGGNSNNSAAQRLTSSSSTDDNPASPASPDAPESVYSSPTSTKSLDLVPTLTFSDQDGGGLYENTRSIGLGSEDLRKLSLTVVNKTRASPTLSAGRRETGTGNSTQPSTENVAMDKLNVHQLKWVHTPPVIHGLQASGEKSAYITMHAKTLDSRKINSSNALVFSDVMALNKTLPAELLKAPPMPCGGSSDSDTGNSYVNLRASAPSETPSSRLEIPESPDPCLDTYESMLTPIHASTPARKATDPSTLPDEEEPAETYETVDMGHSECDGYSSIPDDSKDTTPSLYITILPEEDGGYSVYHTPREVREFSYKEEDGGHDEGETYVNVGRMSRENSRENSSLVDEYVTADKKKPVGKKSRSPRGSHTHGADHDTSAGLQGDNTYDTLALAHTHPEEEKRYTQLDTERGDLQELYSSPLESKLDVSPHAQSTYRNMSSSLPQKAQLDLEKRMSLTDELYVRESSDNRVSLAYANFVRNETSDDSSNNYYEVPGSLFQCRPVYLSGPENPPTTKAESSPAKSGTHLSSQTKNDAPASTSVPSPSTINSSQPPLDGATEDADDGLYRNVGRLSDTEKTTKPKPRPLPKPKAGGKRMSDDTDRRRGSKPGTSATKQIGALPSRAQSFDSPRSATGLLDTRQHYRSQGGMDDDESDDEGTMSHPYVNVLDALGEATTGEATHSSNDVMLPSEMARRRKPLVRMKSIDHDNDVDQVHSSRPQNSSESSLPKDNKFSFSGSSPSLDSIGRFDMQELQLAMRGMRERKS